MELNKVKTIGLTGPLASGKGVIAEKLKSDGWTYLSLSQVVREIAKERGIGETRENLIKLGNQLREDYGLGVLAEKVFDKAKLILDSNNTLDKIVIDGIRNPGEVDALRKNLPNFFLIGVDAPAYLRHKRALERAKTSDPAKLEELKATDEKDIAIGIYDCLEKSNAVIYNFNKTIDDLHRELYGIMHEHNLIRPPKDAYYLGIARAVALRATCLRRKYGAIIVNNDQIVSAGYAGAPRGVPNCTDIGFCYRKERKIPSGQNYDLCRSVHAEMNAINHAGRERTLDAKIYIHGIDLENNGKIADGKPYLLCKRSIINAGISEVITSTKTGEIKHYLVKDWIEELKKDPFADLYVKAG
jgi:dCMP deaminase